jgi:hypothetical protein
VNAVTKQIFKPRGQNTLRAAAANVFSLCFPLFLVDAVRRAHPMALQQFHLLPIDAADLAPGLLEDDPCIVMTSAWIDLSQGPVVLHMPHTHGRHFDLTLIDAAGEPFASLGARTNDDGGLDIFVVAPRWTGEAPQGCIARRAPSEACWAITRTHAHSPLDRRETIEIARRQSLNPSVRRSGEPIAAVNELEPPAMSCLRQVIDLGPNLFFHRLDSVLDRAPIGFERSVRPLLDQILRDLGGPPPAAQWTPELGEAFELGFADGLAAIRAATAAISESRGVGWHAVAVPVHDESGVSLAQAGRAYSSLGAPSREELITLVCEHDGHGRPLRGDRCLRLHFPADALPPVNGFWRLHTRPTASGDRRHGIGNRNDLVIGGDGSLNLVIHDKPPPTSDLANWLAAPSGPMVLVMRLYAPRSAALSGGWRMPPIEIMDLDPEPGPPRRDDPHGAGSKPSRRRPRP